MRNTAHTVYISSRGLKKSLKFDFDALEFNDWSYENDFCSIKDFKISEMPKDLLLQLIGGENGKI